jgi:hypothetical protein
LGVYHALKKGKASKAVHVPHLIWDKESAKEGRA